MSEIRSTTFANLKAACEADCGECHEDNCHIWRNLQSPPVIDREKIREWGYRTKIRVEHIDELLAALSDSPQEGRPPFDGQLNLYPAEDSPQKGCPARTIECEHGIIETTCRAKDGHADEWIKCATRECDTTAEDSPQEGDTNE